MASAAEGRGGDDVAWTRDVEIENKPLTTTGGHVWAAARKLLDYFEACGDAVGVSRPGARVLELGAGVGYLGVALAANLPAAGRVVLTEQAEGGGTDWLRHNVERNQRRLAGKGSVSAVEVATLDWTFYRDFRRGGGGGGGPAEEEGGGGDPEARRSSLALAGESWDFIIGSDLIYNEAGAEFLPIVLRALSSPGTVCYYCHTKHRYTHLDMELYEALDRSGMAWVEVRAPGDDTPPTSPEPMERIAAGELFPDQRIVVFRITRRPGGEES